MYNHSTPEICSIRPMAQVSMLDTSQIPTQSNCQQYIRTNNTAHYVGPKTTSTELRSRYDGISWKWSKQKDYHKLTQIWLIMGSKAVSSKASKLRSHSKKKRGLYPVICFRSKQGSCFKKPKKSNQGVIWMECDPDQQHHAG